jgi:hypothetical protein
MEALTIPVVVPCICDETKKWEIGTSQIFGTTYMYNNCCASNN